MTREEFSFPSASVTRLAQPSNNGEANADRPLLPGPADEPLGRTSFSLRRS